MSCLDGVKDAQGDKIGDWALQVDFESFKCRWCGTVRKLDGAGLGDHQVRWDHQGADHKLTSELCEEGQPRVQGPDGEGERGTDKESQNSC